MPLRIDLHTHTNCSDGSLPPEQLVSAALGAGLDVIAITDHDTLAALSPAMEAARGTRLRVLPGVEVSALYEGHSLHLLAYGFALPATGLAARLKAITMGREERARAMLERLAALGAPLSWQRLTQIGRGTMARPHIARALVEAGHARDVADAFERWIGTGSPAYIPSGRLPAAQAIAAIREAGGQAALAHPLLPARPLDLATALPVLRAAGLSGIEVYHSEHDAATTARLRMLAAGEGLWWCGGSDYHGPSKPHVRLGGVTMPPEVLEQGPFPAVLAGLLSS